MSTKLDAVELDLLYDNSVEQEHGLVPTKYLGVYIDSFQNLHMSIVYRTTLAVAFFSEYHSCCVWVSSIHV